MDHLLKNGKKVHPFNSLSPVCATFFAKPCNAATRQPIKLESCSNPLQIQQVFLVEIKKKNSFFVLGSLGVLQVGVFLATFTQPLGTNPMSHFGN